MSQKPKRIISNFSFDMLQQAKYICRNSILSYKEKFEFQPNFKSQKSNQRYLSLQEKQKHYQSTKMIPRKHTYIVQSNKYCTNKIIKEPSFQNDEIIESVTKKRPNTASKLKRTQSNFESQNKDVKSLFKNQQLSASLQSSQTFQNQKTHQSNVRNQKKFRSFTSVDTKMCVLKTVVNEPMQEVLNQLKDQTPKNRQQKSIKSILSSKQNYYNPYFIKSSNSLIKPVKHLRSKSIEQLKQLCQQQRNLNFKYKIGQKSQQKQNDSKCIIKNKNKFFNPNDTNSNKIAIMYQNYALSSFKKPQKNRIKKSNPTWFAGKDKLKSFDKKINHQNFLITQITK